MLLQQPAGSLCFTLSLQRLLLLLLPPFAMPALLWSHWYLFTVGLFH
jgi:hypothetical protein